MEAAVCLATFPDMATAREIARQLVEQRLAACANLIPGAESIYRWQGKMEQSGEVLCIFKTTTEKADALQAQLKALHPYEVPEFLILPVLKGLPEYLAWIKDSCSPGIGYF